MTPFLRDAMARAEAELHARLLATPSPQLSRGPHGLAGPRAERLARLRRCECGARATRFNRKLSAHVCATCAARDSLRIPLQERAAQVVRLARRLDGVTADDVAAAVSITRGHANSVLSRLVRQGRLRRLSGVGEYEVAS